jgi:hypothetical protein
MVVGLNRFKEFFKEHNDCYLIIGGTACDIILEDAGFTPRATDDIDLILIVEALKPDFVKKFWDFIKEGGYQKQQKEAEKRNCYRFALPANPDFPKQIELFSREPDVIDLEDTAHLTPIPVEEGLSSLSAILLDEDYYHFTRNNSELRDGVHFAKAQTLICLKAFAYLNNKQRKAQGQNVREVDIKKHKNDIFRLTLMLTEGTEFELPEKIKTDLQQFATETKTDLPDPAIFKQNGFPKTDMQEVFKLLTKAFKLIP